MVVKIGDTYFKNSQVIFYERKTNLMEDTLELKITFPGNKSHPIKLEKLLENKAIPVDNIKKEYHSQPSNGLRHSRTTFSGETYDCGISSYTLLLHQDADPLNDYKVGLLLKTKSDPECESNLTNFLVTTIEDYIDFHDKQKL